MDNLIYILFTCITIPLVLMVFLVNNAAKRPIIFFIVGICCAVFAAEVNGLIYRYFFVEIEEITVRITPITEEIIKALPVLFFAKVISNKKENLITISLAIGIGFAVMENTFVLTQSVDSVSFIWAVIRGFGTGIMHGMCTFLVGTGFAFVNKNKKLFIMGTFALLSLAITYHSVFNMLVQSHLKYFGALIPIATYLPFFIIRTKNSNKADNENEKN